MFASLPSRTSSSMMTIEKNSTRLDLHKDRAGHEQLELDERMPLELKHKTLIGVKGNRWRWLDLVGNNSTLKRVVSGCRRSEELSCHDPITRHLKEGDS